MAERARSGILGILVSGRRARRSGEAAAMPFSMPEDEFCRRLCAAGQSLGMLVFVFFVAQAAAASGASVGGYRLAAGEWREDAFPLPDVVYDRALPKSKEEARLLKETLASLKRRKRFVQMNGSLPGKLDVYRTLHQEAELRSYLPETQLYEDAAQLRRMFANYPRGLFLKPSAGMHGKGALRLLPEASGWRIDGRDRRNRPFAARFEQWPEMCEQIARIVSSAPYIVQPCLQLTDEEQRSCDIRALMQKDGFGHWTFTGAAVRLGDSGSVTANLHGGGSAEMAKEALTKRFGAEAALALLARIRVASEQIAFCLERHYGRAAEYGIDFGLEPQGRLWLLEANAKPGRKSFDRDPSTAETAVRRPLAYALLLADGQRPVFPSTRIQRRYIQEVHP